jgi:bifunctional DNase/RNase
MVLCALAASCKRRSEPASSTASPARSSPAAVEPTPVASEAVAADGGVPDGYDLASVWEVVATGEGAAVLVVDAKKTTVLPIFVGGTEALTIQLRVDGKHFHRPLTHGLLSSLVSELGGKPVRAQIDDMHDDTFYGRVVVQQGDRVLELDARPSDAIAISLGSGAPLFVSRSVMLGSGVRREEVEKALRDRELGKPKNVDPISL